MQQDPFAGVFVEEVQEKVGKADKKSRSERVHERRAQLQHDINDPQQRKARNRIRRQQDKQRFQKHLNALSKEEREVFLEQRRRRHFLRKERRREIPNGEQYKCIPASNINVNIMIDLSYEGEMLAKENKSLAKQIELVTIAMKKMQGVPRVHLCSFGGKAKEQLERMHYQYLPLIPHAEDVRAVGREIQMKVVYLSPDAERELESVEEDTAYVIGGLVDRTIIKNASLNRAKELGVEARCLPIRNFMKNRICLNVDHVVSMLCRFKESKCWQDAFQYAAPKRWKRNQPPKIKNKRNNRNRQQAQILPVQQIQTKEQKITKLSILQETSGKEQQQQQLKQQQKSQTQQKQQKSRNLQYQKIQKKAFKNDYQHQKLYEHRQKQQK